MRLHRKRNYFGRMIGRGAGMIAGQNYIGASYSAITGQLAHPRTQTSILLTQLSTLESVRLSNVTLGRSTKFYFSGSGNDGNAGTIGSPYRSLAKLATIVSGYPTGGMVQFLFNKGDIYYPTNSDDLIILRSGMTIGAYGTGNKPILSCFVGQILTTDTWTLDAGTPGVDATYSIAVPQVSWLAYKDPTLKLTSPITKALSLAFCRANANTFFWSGGTLYFRMTGGTNPTGTAWEYVKGITGASPHFDLYGTNIRCEGVRFEGWGICLDANKADSVYGVKNDTVNATDEQVMKDCELYYTGYHAGSAIGPGKVTYKSVTVGHARLRSANSCTMFVGYSDNGGHETLILDCTCAYGNLWEDNGTGIQGRTAQSAYGHVGVSGSMAIAVCRNMTCSSGTYSCLQSASFDNLPTAKADPTYATNETNIRSARGFIINELMNYASTETIQGMSESISIGGVVRINGRWNGKVGWTGTASAGDPGTGWFINCCFNFNNTTAGVQNYMSVFRPITGKPNFVNCHLEMKDQGALFGTSLDAANWADLSLHNCVLSGYCYYLVTPGLYDYVTTVNASISAGNVKNCLIFSKQPCTPTANSTPAGTAGDGAYQTSSPGLNQYRARGAPSGGSFVNMPVILASVVSGDTDMYNTGSTTLQPELDFNGVTRGSRATIGPVNGT